MSRLFSDDNTNVDSEAETARRRNFIRRMETKLEFKKSVVNPNYDDERYLIR